MSRYWLFSGDAGMNYDVLKERLSAAGLVPYPDTNTVRAGHLLYSFEPAGVAQVEFLHVELTEEGDISSSVDHRTHSIHTRVHNRYDSRTVDILRHKDQLHAALAGSNFIARTAALDKFEYTGGVWILRPSHIMACSGLDILVVSNSEEFNRAKEFYAARAQAHHRFHKLHMKYYHVIVSEYIMEPLLMQERKFHLRLYMLVRNNRRPSIARRHGRILTAADPYKQADWSNKRIHDTHVKSTRADFLYPRDFPAQDMLPGINEQLNALEVTLSTLCADITPYTAQAKSAYEIFGLDIMVRADGRVVLIEINDNWGCKFEDKNGADFKHFARLHNEWMWEHIADMFA
jgi:hypothetical protein